MRSIEQAGKIGDIQTASHIAGAVQEQPAPALSAGNAIPGAGGRPDTFANVD